MPTRRIPNPPRPGARAVPSAASPATAGADPKAIRSLRDRIAARDAVLAALAAGISSRGRETQPPGPRAATSFSGGPVADAAEALAEEAASAVEAIEAGPGGRRIGDELARAAAALQVRVARLRLRLIERAARARSDRSCRRD